MRPPVTSAQCIIATKKCPHAAIKINYDDYLCSWRNGEIREAFRALTKEDILKSYTSDHDFRSTNVNDAEDDDAIVGYYLYVSDLQYRKILEAAQPIK